ncbi:hypothetical protein LXL04_002940 [Taraxacum kok-saghyz]
MESIPTRPPLPLSDMQFYSIAVQKKQKLSEITAGLGQAESLSLLGLAKACGRAGAAGLQGMDRQSRCVSPAVRGLEEGHVGWSAPLWKEEGHFREFRIGHRRGHAAG